MKILMITNSFAFGGAERRLRELIKGLKRYPNYSIGLVILTNKVYYNISDLKIDTFILKKSKYDFLLFFKLIQICKKFKPDIIHSWNGLSSFYSGFIANYFNITFVNGMITDSKKLSGFNKENIYKEVSFLFSDYFLANSRAGIESYNVMDKNSFCIYNGFDFRRIKKLKSKEKIFKKFKIPQGVSIIGMVAGFKKNKDYKTYIQAAKKVAKEKRNIIFLAVGNGYLFKEIKKNVKNKYKKYIKFLGWQSDVESIVNTFDIGILSTYTEGISNSIMEYMALGKPVIATRGGGTEELVLEGETGFLIPPKSPDILADKILHLLNNNEMKEEMGIRGRNRIKRKFDIDMMINKYKNLYEKIN